MKTVQRLKETFTSGRLEMFDTSSKYVILSDCHRGIGEMAINRMSSPRIRIPSNMP